MPKVSLTPENFAEGARGTAVLLLKNNNSSERNFYSSLTSMSKAEVECFALEVRASILARNWQAFAQCVYFPVMLNGEECPNTSALIAIAPELLTEDNFVKALVSETCEDMFFNYAGIIMADGCLHLGEGEGGGLRVTAINTPT